MTDLVCSQCGRHAPADPAELADWEHGPALTAGDLTDETAALLLCPDCRDENREREFDEGGSS